MGRFIQFAIAAADCAIASAGLRVDPAEAENVGVYIGSGIGGFEVIEREHQNLLEHGPRRISPFFIPATIVNLASGYVSIRTGAKGPNSATATACTTSAHSIGDSFRIIQHNDADVMIAGGAEAAITPMGVGGFAAMRALSTRNDDPEKASRPWDRDRDGFVLSEGSGVVILEELEHARRRGSKIYAELLGSGSSADAYNITAPHPCGQGAARAMERALKAARLNPSDIDYINAHGTGTPLGDESETKAIKEVFGSLAPKIAISSTKSMVGHLLGASGGVELIACCLSIQRSVIHPTINLDNPDPACDLDYVPNQPREKRVRRAISNSFGFGGHNCCLVVGAFA